MYHSHCWYCFGILSFSLIVSICLPFLKYPLYYGELKEHRQDARGTVTVRLRVEFTSVRNALLKALQPPPNYVVALRSTAEKAVAYYTAQGAFDEEQFNIGTMTRYWTELMEYYDLTDTIKGAFLFVSTSICSNLNH